MFCEGAQTEPGYLKALRSVFANALLSIETLEAVGGPITIAQQASAYAKGRKRVRKSFFEKGDQVWAVFDRDEHPRFLEAVNLCRQSNVGVAQSNPCFELWLILHVEDFDKPEDRRNVCRRLGALRADYDSKKKVLNFSELISRIDDAEARAGIQLERRTQEGAPNGNPSTTVVQLTKAIRKAAEKSDA